MDIADKAAALLDWDDIGDITLNEWERDMLTNIVELDELGRDVWTENRAAKVDEIYREKAP